MSTLAGMYIVNSVDAQIGIGQEPPSASACSMADPDNANSDQVSEDENDNTSCSNSEMGSEVCNLSVKDHKNHNQSSIYEPDEEESIGNNTPSSKDNNSNSSSSRRKNKRKNFMPRNIMEYAGSDEDDEHHHHHHHHHHKGSIKNRDSGLSLLQQQRQSIEPSDDEPDPDHEAPLDLSEVQTSSKKVWKSPSSALPFPTSFMHPGFMGNSGCDPQSGPSLPFYPMDLRLSALAAAGFQNPRSRGYDEEDMGISSTSSTTSNNSLHNGNGLNNNNNNNNAPSTNPPTTLTDFAESTMKELIGLYGIAENLKQGGKPSPGDLSGLHRHLTDPTSGQYNSKMMQLPKNMALFLAAMQDMQNANPSNGHGSSHHQHQHHESDHNSRSVQNSSPLSSQSGNGMDRSSPPASGGGLSMLKSQLYLNNNNHGESSSPIHDKSLTNHHHQHKLSKSAKGKSSVAGRGLSSPSFPVIREGLLGKGSGPVDFSRYVRKFGSSAECGYQHCRDLNYREHFHCLECGHGTRVFLKKEEMIRHFKWHKKRDESLQHGFMRYSPSDDCGDRFNNCPHNRKQTHYHCLHDPCEKVYISTSDVQMHANYHRKDSAIIQEGFQRFRAAEDCGSDCCSFRRQRTTHFHCRRSTCSFTFKNKADMEKHKSYHIKDEQLNRDGFKKFMKHEACNYTNCRFSRVCNHIHCIREGCFYVLHSSGQLYSHKRKHERRDSELAYRKFKLNESIMRGTLFTDLTSIITESFLGKFDDNNSNSSSKNELADNVGAEDTIKKLVQPCKCDLSPEDHFHCKAEACLNVLLGNAEITADHTKAHELEDRISSLAYFSVDPANFDAQDLTIPCVSSKCAFQTREKHYHCLWDGCTEIVLESDEPFKRLEHFKEHEANHKLDPTIAEKSTQSLDGFFRRKRGRPPKDRVIEVSSGANEAIFTSFKLPKPMFPGGSLEDSSDHDVKDPIGFLSFPDGVECPDTACSYNNNNCNKPSPQSHYHCGHPRCHFSVDDVNRLSMHLRDFHSNVDILDGYEYFEKSANCKSKSAYSKCEFNGNANHFHCARDGFTFTRYQAMSAHEDECHVSKYGNGTSSDEDEKSWNSNVVKSKGTFYPIKTNEEKKYTPDSDAMDLSGSNGDAPETKPITDHSLSRILQLPASSETQYGPEHACGRPFCKLKRKSHFHCDTCNQAFSDLDKLRPHVLKHNSLTAQSASKESEQGDSDSEDSFKAEIEEPQRKSKSPNKKLEVEKNSFNFGSPGPGLLDPSISPYPNAALSNFLGYPSPHANPYLLFPPSQLSSLYAGMFGGGAFQVPSAGVLSPTQQPPTPMAEPIPVSSPILNAGNLKRPPSASSSPSSPPDKKQRMQLRILKDEPVPEGYVRFRFNEDCQFTHCGYREHQTHFHCTREDCGYSFCDKTRFVQHTARHERLDTLMGGDFKQFRANVPCGRSDCSYLAMAPPAGSGPQAQNKASHFHCSKCEFVCTDTNKVVAHRRQHQKLDSINAAGFQKYTPSQNCNIDACIHAQKQTHYHCLKCNYAVLGLSQMSAHKFRHSE